MPCNLSSTKKLDVIIKNETRMLLECKRAEILNGFTKRRFSNVAKCHLELLFFGIS